ncbi:exodeoxyribonuclease VII large subunit [Kiloniella sp. b19]|uniref:exodeoxyribonuclease VII large subunit n=1 Tax=Kiloniella sp. GXU_MW_B19 TaxID=3141326 RepID=UPI0031D9DC87
MSDLFSVPPRGPAAPGGGDTGNNAPAMTVSEISGSIKRTLESRFDHVRVRGEISGLKRAASGHIYLSLKDDQAVINSICWRGSASKLSVQPQDGMEVICTGRVSSYPGRSNYQLIIESMELAGQGALLKLLEERRQALAAEGLFATERKKVLPLLPEVIGVVTSPTGAVIRDILHRLRDRFPRRVLVWPVLVQGDGAAEQVAAAIRGFNAMPADGVVPRPDLLIVARGGGSLEDLWAFNEEVVVRAAADSRIPLISAVGHETDTTLIDFASDRRAPTPTAAAEMAVPVRSELIAEVQDLGRRLYGAAQRLGSERRMQLDALSRGLPDLQRIVEEKTQRLDERAERLTNGMQVWLRQRGNLLAELNARLPHPRQQIRFAEQQLEPLSERLQRAGPQVISLQHQKMDQVDAERRLKSALELRVERAAQDLSALDRVLQSVSYKNVLRRGFSVVRGQDGGVLKADEISAGDMLSIEFADDRSVAARAQGGEADHGLPQQEPEQPVKVAARKAARPKKDDSGQTSLF